MEVQVEDEDRNFVEIDSDDEVQIERPTTNINASHDDDIMDDYGRMVNNDNVEDINHDNDHHDNQLSNMRSRLILIILKAMNKINHLFAYRLGIEFHLLRYPPHDYVLVTSEGEPTCYQESIGREDEHEWMEPMREEMNSLEKNNTFTLVDKVPRADERRDELIREEQHIHSSR
ncbi:hypothetical protein LIER_23467 [Lithospermum erythrorhizon]|uniref:Uncharacterized protein n=1 Tax=Lithospermum erythrorhizon TaxID=34254 RepID=A0AAV3R1S9_LITER